MKLVFEKIIKYHWDAILASIAGCIFICYFTHHSGIGISPDSVIYESVATNIRNQFSFTDFNGTPLVDFPLGYPLFLAKASFITGIPVIKIVPLLNCILFTGVILLTSVIIQGYQKKSYLFKACFLAILACSPCLLEVYSMLWSETLFIFLILLFVVAMRNYFRSHSILALLAMAMVVAFAFVTRYAGISLLGAGVFLLLFDGELSLRKKLQHIFIFGITGSSLAISNLLRNSRVAGSTTGVREKALRSVTDNLQQIGTTISDWLPFVRGHEKIATILFLVVLLSGIFILAYRIFQQQYYQSYENIVACFFVVYTVFLIIIATISRFENLSSRLLSPVYIPFLLVGSSWIIAFVQRSVRIKQIVLIVLFFVLYAGFHYNHYQLNAEAWEGIKDAGMPGYTEDSWTQSPVVAFVKKNKDSYATPVYANANDAVYFLTGIHALPLPHKEIQKEIDVFLQHTSFTLIWFIDGENPDLVSLDFIKQHKKLVSAQETEAGAVYFFSDTASKR